jgi:alpha-L-fucosidase
VQFSDNDVTFTGQDIRFTTKGDRLFAIALGKPPETVVIKSLAEQQVHAVKLLGCEENPSWSQDAAGLKIQVPKDENVKHPWVFEILNG